MSWIRDMNNEGIEGGPFFDLKDTGDGERIMGIRSQALNRLGGKSNDPSFSDDFCGLMNGLRVSHPDFASLIAFDFFSNDFFVSDLKSSNFLVISGYLIERISQAR